MHVISSEYSPTAAVRMEDASAELLILLARFEARIRSDPLLAAIAAHEDWADHLALLRGFWTKLMSGKWPTIGDCVSAFEIFRTSDVTFLNRWMLLLVEVCNDLLDPVDALHLAACTNRAAQGGRTGQFPIRKARRRATRPLPAAPAAIAAYLSPVNTLN